MNKLGKTGEGLAVKYLQSIGYKILERNWKWHYKEIDIICTDGRLLIIAEVKTRKNNREEVSSLLNYKKKKNLLQAASAYLDYKRLQQEIRFDLIIIHEENNTITHIPEAIQVFD